MPNDRALEGGHPEFYRLLDELAALHAAKNADYSGDNPLRNLRLCEQIGVDAWRGVLVRMSDKWSRVVTLANHPTSQVKDESLDDSLKDLAVYALLAIILRREAQH